MADNTVRGRFVWHELRTPNKAGAHEFYTNALGWKTQAWEQDPSYSMFAAPSGPLGASVETREGAPHWLPYIGTTDVDATVEAATRLGARVTTPPTTLSNAGRFAVLIDPHGAPFGVHGSPTEPQAERPTQEGEFHWHELATNATPDEAFDFYSDLFGWDEMGRHDMGPNGIYLLFGRDGTQRGGMFRKGDTGKPGPAYWVGYVRVSDVDDTVEKVKAARGSLLNGPMDVPGGERIAQLVDPHGAFFAVHMAAADAKASAAKAGARKEAGAAQGAAGKPATTKPAAAKPATGEPATAKPAAAKPGKAVKKGKKAAKKAAQQPAKKAAKGSAKKSGGKKAARKALKSGKAAKKSRRTATKKAGAKKAGKKKRPAAKKSAKRKAKRRR